MNTMNNANEEQKNEIDQTSLPPSTRKNEKAGTGSSGGFLANATREQLVKHLTEAAKKLKAFEKTNKQLNEQLDKQKKVQEDVALLKQKKENGRENEEEIHEEVKIQSDLLKEKLRMEVEEKENWAKMAKQLKVNFEGVVDCYGFTS